MTQRVNVHIERLILEGLIVAARDRAALGAALEGELARLIADGGLPARLAGGGTVPSLPAAAIQLSGDNDPAQLGRQIAGAVYGGESR
jgi:hypothetical protein